MNDPRPFAGAAVAACCEGHQATHALRLVQAMRSANVRADAVVFSGECVRAKCVCARNRATAVEHLVAPTDHPECSSTIWTAATWWRRAFEHGSPFGASRTQARVSVGARGRCV